MQPPKRVLARLQSFTRSTLLPDLLLFIGSLRDGSVADLQTAETKVEMFRAQGQVQALDSLEKCLENLRDDADIVDDEPQANVAIPAPLGTIQPL